MLIGHIASGKHAKYIRMAAPDDIKMSDRLFVSARGGEDILAFQWVFRSTKARDDIEDNIAGKVWFRKWTHTGQKIQ